jgi:hypothetical protein
VLAGDVLVCPEALRRSAAALSSIGQRLAYETAGPPLEVPAEGPRSVVVLGELTAAVRRRIDLLAASTVEVATLVCRVAGEYEAADDRAARRTRTVA